MGQVSAHLVALSLSLVGLVLGRLLLHRVLGDTVLLEHVIVLVDILELLLLVLHHHADLEHALGEVLDWNLLHSLTVDELKLKDLLGNSVIKLIIVGILGGGVGGELLIGGGLLSGVL